MTDPHIAWFQLLVILIIWSVPLILLGWFIRTLSAMSRSLRDIAIRLSELELATRKSSRNEPPREG